MKNITTLFLPVFAIGMLAAFVMLSKIDHENFGVLQWCLAVVVVLSAGWIVAMLLNLAIFAPIYWLLGRSQSKKTSTKAKQTHDA
jgi:hypothetical protein